MAVPIPSRSQRHCGPAVALTTDPITKLACPFHLGLSGTAATTTQAYVVSIPECPFHLGLSGTAAAVR